MPEMIVNMQNAVTRGIYAATQDAPCTAIPVTKTVTSTAKPMLQQNAVNGRNHRMYVTDALNADTAPMTSTSMMQRWLTGNHMK